MTLSDTMHNNIRGNNKIGENSGSMSLNHSPKQNTRQHMSLEKTRLMIFCQQEESSEVKRLLCNDESVRVLDPLGRTALHYCKDNKSTKIAAMLLNRDLSIIDVRDINGYTALQMSVMAGNHQMVNFLIRNGADARTRDSEQRTLIHWATVCGHVHMIDILAKHGAYLSSTDVHNACPLHYVSQMCGAAEEDDGQYHAASLSLLQKLICKKALVDVLDLDLRTPLFWAASAGSVEACEMLIKAGANLNHRDKDGLTALHCAAARGQSHCIDVLLKKKVITVDVVDYSGCTPLFYAVSLGHVETTRALLEKHHSNPSHRDYKQRSPAHCAAAKGSVECLRILRATGGDLWIRNARGDYPIHEAALAHQNDAVKYLLGTKPDSIDSSNDDGRTCLHIAALTNNLPLVMHLVDNNASKKSVMVCEGKSVTPFDGAVFKSNTDCAEYLRVDDVDEKKMKNNSRTNASNVLPSSSRENVLMKENAETTDGLMREAGHGLKRKTSEQLKDGADELEEDSMAVCNSSRLRGTDELRGKAESKEQLANKYVKDEEENVNIQGVQIGNNRKYLLGKDSEFWVSPENKDGNTESGKDHVLVAALNAGRVQAPDQPIGPGEEYLHGASIRPGQSQLTDLAMDSGKEQNAGSSVGPGEGQFQRASYEPGQVQVTDLTLRCEEEKKAGSPFGPGKGQFQQASHGPGHGQIIDSMLGSGDEKKPGSSFGPNEGQSQGTSLRRDQGQTTDLSLKSKKEQNVGSSFGPGNGELQSVSFGPEQCKSTGLILGSGKVQKADSSFGLGEGQFQRASDEPGQDQITDLTLNSEEENTAGSSFEPDEGYSQRTFFTRDQGQTTDLALGSGKAQDIDSSFGEQPLQSASIVSDKDQNTSLILGSEEEQNPGSSCLPSEGQFQQASNGPDQGQIINSMLGSGKEQKAGSSFGPDEGYSQRALFRQDQSQTTDLSLGSVKEQNIVSSFGLGNGELQSASFGPEQCKSTGLILGSGKVQKADSSFGLGEGQFQRASDEPGQDQITDLTLRSGEEKKAGSYCGPDEGYSQRTLFTRDQGQTTDLALSSWTEQKAGSSSAPGEGQSQRISLIRDQGQTTDLTFGSRNEQNIGSFFEPVEQQLQSTSFGPDQVQTAHLILGSGKEQNIGSSFGPGEGQYKRITFGQDQGQITDLTLSSGQGQNTGSYFGPDEKLQSASFGSGQNQNTDMTLYNGQEKHLGSFCEPGERQLQNESTGTLQCQIAEFPLSPGKQMNEGCYMGSEEGQLDNAFYEARQGLKTTLKFGTGMEQSSLGPEIRHLPNASLGTDLEADLSLAALKHTSNLVPEQVQGQDLTLTLNAEEKRALFDDVPGSSLESAQPYVPDALMASERIKSSKAPLGQTVGQEQNLFLGQEQVQSSSSILKPEQGQDPNLSFVAQQGCSSISEPLKTIESDATLVSSKVYECDTSKRPQDHVQNTLSTPRGFLIENPSFAVKKHVTCGLTDNLQENKLLAMTLETHTKETQTKETQTENFLSYDSSSLLICSPSQDITNSSKESGTCPEKKDDSVKCREIFEMGRKMRNELDGRTAALHPMDDFHPGVQSEKAAAADDDHRLETGGLDSLEDVNSVGSAKKMKRRLKCKSIQMRRDATTQTTDGQYNRPDKHRGNKDSTDQLKDVQALIACKNVEKHLKKSDNLQDEDEFEQSMPSDMTKQSADDRSSSRKQRAGQTKNLFPINTNKVGRADEKESWETDDKGASTDSEFDDAELQKERNAVKWPHTVKHQRWAEKLESVKYIWNDSEDEEDHLPVRRSVSISNSRDSSPERSSLLKRSNSISVPREYYLRKKSLQAYLARNPCLKYTTGHIINSVPHARKSKRNHSQHVYSNTSGSNSKDEAFKWLHEESDRFREQMRIYGFHSEVDKPNATLHPLSSGRSSSIYCGRSPSSSQHTFKDDLEMTLEQVFGKYKWWQKFCMGGLKPGKNLIQEYVRIYETKRLIMMEMQKAKRIQMLNVNKGPSVDRMLAKQMVDDFNQQAREEHRIGEWTQFGNLSDFCKYLRDEVVNLDEEEKLLKKLEKLLHLKTIDEIGPGELTVLRQMISTITSKHPDRNRNKSTVGNGNSHDGKFLWSLANMRSNATKSASKMAQLHYVESINRPTMSRHLTSNTDMAARLAPVILTGNSHCLPQLLNKGDMVPQTVESTSASAKSPKFASYQMSKSWPNDAAAILPPVYNIAKNTWHDGVTYGKGILMKNKRSPRTLHLPVLSAPGIPHQVANNPSSPRTQAPKWGATPCTHSITHN